MLDQTFNLFDEPKARERLENNPLNQFRKKIEKELKDSENANSTNADGNGITSAENIICTGS